MKPTLNPKYADTSNEQLAAIIKTSLEKAGVMGLMLDSARTLEGHERLTQAVAGRQSLLDEARTCYQRAAIVLGVPEAKEACEALFARNMGLIVSAARQAAPALRKYGVEEDDYIHEFFIFFCGKIAKYKPETAQVNTYFKVLFRSFRDDFAQFHAANTGVMYSNALGHNAAGQPDDKNPVEVTGRRLGSADKTPVEELIAEEERKAVFAAIETLPEHEKITLKKQVEEGKSYAEIAQELNLPAANNAGKRIRSATRRLKQLLDTDSPQGNGRG